MRFFEIIILAVTVAVISAEDDGQYRPELYGGDDGSYHPEYQQRQLQFYNGYNGRVSGTHQYQPSSGFLKRFDPDQDDTVIINAAQYQPSYPIYQRRQGYRSNTNDGQARTFYQDSAVGTHGYQYQYQTENGIAAASSGRLKATADGRPALRTSGFYEYVGDDGLTYRVDYVADENGYRATGAHLPVQPHDII